MGERNWKQAVVRSFRWTAAGTLGGLVVTLSGLDYSEPRSWGMLIGTLALAILAGAYMDCKLQGFEQG